MWGKTDSLDYGVLATVSLFFGLVNGVMKGEFVDAFDVLPACVDGGDWVKHFIEAYETLPELWNKVLSIYMYKHKKQTAVEKLLVIYREIKPQGRYDKVEHFPFQKSILKVHIGNG